LSFSLSFDEFLFVLLEKCHIQQICLNGLDLIELL